MNALRQYLMGLIATVVLGFAVTTDACADYILGNADFGTPNPKYTTTTLTGPKSAGPSVAASWSIWNNNPGTTTTELLRSTYPGGGTNMIHVVTTGGANGLVQIFAPFKSGPTNVLATAYVYVLSGRVSLGTGNGGDTGSDVISTKTNTWERLQASNGVSPANELTIYSYGGAANFYVGYASIGDAGHTADTPEPSALILSTLGVFITGLGNLYRRRRTSKRL
jgi:hypothetical protein